MTPDNHTISERNLDVGSGHSLYIQEWGNKTGPAILYLHGGPGSGCRDSAKMLFNPDKHRVIFFDQRGCGKSTPYGSLADNNTDTLIEDINRIASEFGITEFSITGGSWGSCLALAYAIKNPERVRRMIIRGIFTGRASEIDFLDKGGVAGFFPDVWEEFLRSVPEEHRDSPREFHMPNILGDDPAKAKQSAYAYSKLEGSVAMLDDRSAPESFDTFDPIPTTIESQYLVNRCFLEENYIFNNAHQLTMPVHFVQGRYDAVCPPSTAYELYKKLPDATLSWTLAGHSGSDRANWEITRAIIDSVVV